AAGAEAKALVPTGTAFDCAMGVSGSGWCATAVSIAAAGGHAKLSARPAGAASVSPLPRTFVAIVSPRVGLLPGAPSSLSESLSLSFAIPVSGITGPTSGRSVGFESEGAASNDPEGSATGTRLLI